MQSFSRDSTILLSSSDTKHTPFDASKPIYIGVYGATNPESMYTLLVTSDNGNITLIDGMPQVGEVLKNARHLQWPYTPLPELHDIHSFRLLLPMLTHSLPLFQA